jgi:anthranilate phosphoribosyltransferase
VTYAELVQPLIERKDMTPEHAAEVMDFLIGGKATDAQIGGILLGLRIKGCTTRELAAFVTVMRQRATLIGHQFDDLVDTCGTGGGRLTFNISTAAAIVAAAAGVRIAKHGNRSVTGLGSADVLEELGIPIGGSPEVLLHELESAGIIFMFAPAHHPAMKHVAAARKDLGIRTVFNQLGPLANPAGARRQLIGVYDPGLMRSMGEALRELGTERALLVHGIEGLDEVSPCGETEVVRVWEGKVSNLRLTPADFGLEPVEASALDAGATISDCARILREALTEADSPRSRAVLPSAAAAIWLGGLAEDLPTAVDRAKTCVRDGTAIRLLDRLASPRSAS